MDPTAKRSPYQYHPLLSEENQIRLIRLMPSKDKDATIECQVFNYSLNPAKGIHLYEALSYVWGNAKETVSINIDKRLFDATKNLYAALLRLRDDYFDRILWVDAICINQMDEREKEKQIWLMSRIYGHASRVIVWLGNSESAHGENSDRVLEEIRAIAEKGHAEYPDSQIIRREILTLLQRPWFRRVWVSES